MTWKAWAILLALFIAVLAVALAFRVAVKINEYHGGGAADWLSTHKPWVEFSETLRRGGRARAMTWAMMALREGASEDDVRSTLGAPDLVTRNAEEWRRAGLSNAGAPPDGASGAYFYKVGPLFGSANSTSHVVVFDQSGRVMSVFGSGIEPTSPLNDLTVDTRTNQRVVR